MSVFLFWNNIRKTSELLIIRHYLKLKKILLIFSIFVAIFSYLEINKTELNVKITNLKELYLKKSMENSYNKKIFFEYGENSLIITRLDGISKTHIKEVSVYEFENEIFKQSIYSNVNMINDNKIIMENPKIITPYTIKDTNKFEIKINKFGEYFYNKDNKISLYDNNKKSDAVGILKKITLVLILFTYVVILLSKKAIQKNTSILKYIIIIFLIFIYSFITSQTYFENYNNQFQISVLLIFALNLYKNLMNE
ncbi:hypothetical protein OAC15_05230 [Alphaproteobacteria bacterium]|nr:hypothetical protein [Alphaproteobacteria bacterium]